MSLSGLLPQTRSAAGQGTLTAEAEFKPAGWSLSIMIFWGSRNQVLLLPGLEYRVGRSILEAQTIFLECLAITGCCCYLSCFCHVRLFVTPWTVACQAPLSVVFPRQEDCSGLPFPSPGDLSDSGIEPRSLALQADSLLSQPQVQWVMNGLKFSEPHFFYL